MITEQALTRILAQPDYGIVGGLTVAKPRRNQPRQWATEWDFQAAIIAEAKQRAIVQPEYSLLVAIPNGQYRKGQRPEAGLTPGMPDLALLVRRGGHGALFIELKCGANKCSPAQRDKHYELRREGYVVAVIWDSLDEVFQVIEEYLRL